jgi:hypothetical protein
VRTVSLPSYAPNPYEVSYCQETNAPEERRFAFFRWIGPGVIGLWQRVLT